MFYYVLTADGPGAAENDFRIMQVTAADQAAFLAAYGHLVIAQGTSIAEAIIAFGERDTQAG
ncbi:MAG TPA: hypothetical protein PLQ32_00740 [Flavihumibacter sp.]|nr:hypothetical protein [Flavihumibacter sp.]HPZ86597.1 hypothetical protein [Flavihumibacter sp.]HQD08447.1 hypothetical protein [Flavihumibacter sp.]